MYYDKRIRYLSYYESGIKLQNAGYVKFQVRDSLCQMIIYVKGPRLMGSGEGAVYLLSRKQDQTDTDGFYLGGRDSRLQKHLLGNLNICNGQGHCAVRMNAENMADSGLRYDEICGIKIELHEYQYLESQWSITNFMPKRVETQIASGTGYRLRRPQGERRSSEGKNQVNDQGSIVVKPQEEGGIPDVSAAGINLIVTPVSENLRVEKLVRQDWMQGESNVMELSERGRLEADVKMETEAAAAEADMEEKADRDTTKANMEEKAGSVAAKAAIEEISGRTINIVGDTGVMSGRAAFPENTGENAEKIVTVTDMKGVSERENTEREIEEKPGETAAKEKIIEKAEKVESVKREVLADWAADQEPVGEKEDSMEEMLEREVRRKEAQLGRSEQMEEIRPEEQELHSDKWEQLRKIYPVVHPIREEEEYLKIAPKDFVIFSEKYQELVHNSFLLHGYYNYKHLILGKREKDGRVIYYLGVPGTFHDREKTVAVMFGFEAFDGKREPAENGDFGYYLRRVEI